MQGERCRRVTRDEALGVVVESTPSPTIIRAWPEEESTRQGQGRSRSRSRIDRRRKRLEEIIRLTLSLRQIVVNLFVDMRRGTVDDTMQRTMSSRR